MNNPYNRRLRLVESSKQRGSKATARPSGCAAPTALKRLRRQQQHGSAGTPEGSRARHRQAHKTQPR